MSLQEIKDAIARLPAHELAELMAWVAEYHATNWDRLIAADLDAGRLDPLLPEIEDD